MEKEGQSIVQVPQTYNIVGNGDILGLQLLGLFRLIVHFEATYV
jgi:hypothetical protein